ncbi:MAG: putative toxin-antitoxin system toxin component, PIN family [Patescibacteria group bacterium]|nr:putative toxin-antitoxin system toxin component, PIN family [Patescibacteria group bacterium]
MPSLTVFLDASVILSGMASPLGGSGFLLQAAQKKKISLITTPLVINEVNRHLNKLKLQSKQLKTLLNRRIIHLVKDPNEIIIARCRHLTADPHDAHVLAGAILTNVNFLLSLDKKHILTKRVKKHLFPIRVLAPKQFWQSI